MGEATVLDAAGQQLSATSEEKARRLVRDGQAVLLQEAPLTIQLNRAVQMPTKREEAPAELPGQGRSALLHICCAPCATYTVKRMRELGFGVTGYWYNPNIHPFSEHERRRETLAAFAPQIDLTVAWERGYDIVDYFRAVHGQERFRLRCQLCYRLRLERTARVAAAQGYDSFTTTLLISPYQDQAAIQGIGDELAAAYGLEFFFENLRRGWAEHARMTREHDLYSQRYCGCVYSEWEALDRSASTYPRDR